MGRRKKKWKRVDDIELIELDALSFVRLYHNKSYYDMPLDDYEMESLHPFIQENGDPHFTPTAASSYEEDIAQEKRTISKVCIRFDQDGFVKSCLTLRDKSGCVILRYTNYPERIVYFYYQQIPILLHIDLFKMNESDPIDSEDRLIASKNELNELLSYQSKDGTSEDKRDKRRIRELISEIRELEIIIVMKETKSMLHKNDDE